MTRRWTESEEEKKKRELLKLYVKQNKSIREVGKILGIAESTVYDRLVRLGISSLRARKPRYNNIRDDLLIPKYSEDLAEFTGILLGDGHLNPTQVTVTPLSNQ